RFSGQFSLASEDRAAFLRCLATLGLRMAPGDAPHPGLVHEPGVLLALDERQGTLASIYTWGKVREEPATASVTQEALASHLIAGARDPDIDPGLRDAIARSPAATAYV